MGYIDQRGCEVSGATPVALDAYERALAAFVSWRSGAAEHLGAALQVAPEFVMAHVLRAWMALTSRDPQRVRSARSLLENAIGLSSTERERLHLAAIAATLADDYEGAKVRLGEVLLTHPRDLVALQVAHAFDYLTGDTERLRDRVSGVLAAWSHEVPGYHAVLAMHAFGLEECGDYARAEQIARAALELDPADARAHHVMAHVFEMTGRAKEGERWLVEHEAHWSVDTVVARHCWWHLALFHLAQGRLDRALAIYDRRIRADRSTEVADLIDAAALLWRVELLPGETGSRWVELAQAWAPHIDDRFCSFSDVHAMLAFVGARDWARAKRLELVLTGSNALPTRYGRTTRQLGLPAGRALIAFGRRHFLSATALLAGLSALAHRLGGSHAQRDVLQLTLRNAVKRFRRAGDGRPSPVNSGNGQAASGQTSQAA